MGFVLVMIVIAVLLITLAKLCEVKLLKAQVYHVSRTKYLTISAMMAALASVLMLFEVPVFFAPPFYKIDLSELPVMIGGMYLGPVAAVLIELLKILLKLVMKGTTTAFVGDFANFAVGCSLVLPAVIIYHTRKTKQRALAGLLCGTLIMTVFGTLFNAWYLLPAFSALYGMPMDALIEMGTAVNSRIHDVTTFVVFSVGPLNLLKGVVISILTMLLYKHISKLFHSMMEES